MTMQKALYIHIPFCPSWCKFCHFYLQGKIESGYIDLLEKEFILRFWKWPIHVDCIHIWWGTPNLLSISELWQLLSFLTKKCVGYREFSIELHPSLCSEKQIDILAHYGINRVSFGIQSLDQSVLSYHTRVYGNYKNLGSFVMYARKKWIKKINFDFIFDLIGDSIENIQKNIQFISDYRPSSVYYYRLRCFTEHLKRNYIPSEKRTFWYYLQVKQSMQKLWYNRLNNAVYYDQSQLHDSIPFLYDEIIYSHEHDLIWLWVAATSEVDNQFTKNFCSLESYKNSLYRNNSPVDLQFSLDIIPRMLNRFYFFLLQKPETSLRAFIDTFGDHDIVRTSTEKLEELGFLQYSNNGSMRVTEKGHYYFDDKIGDILFSEYGQELELLKKL